MHRGLEAPKVSGGSRLGVLLQAGERSGDEFPANDNCKGYVLGYSEWCCKGNHRMVLPEVAQFALARSDAPSARAVKLVIVLERYDSIVATPCPVRSCECQKWR